MVDSKFLDSFEKILCDGLVKIARGAGFLKEYFPEAMLPISPDIEDLWDKKLIKDYIADAVANFNSYPEAALSWAGFLGMAVAHYWDTDWLSHKDDSYSSFYGSRGFDDMDEHILGEVLGLNEVEAKKLSDTFLSMAIATLGLIQHEAVETQTELGFYTLARCYTVIYKIGAAIWLSGKGYVLG